MHEQIINKKIELPAVQYLHAKAAQKRKCLSINMELTVRCNFNCKMCYVHNGECNTIAPLELSTDDWLNIARQAQQNGVLFVLLTGGEPLLREDFCEIYTSLCKMGFVVSVNTNLSLLNEKIEQCFIKYRPDIINASLYGMSDEVYKNLCENAQFSVVEKNIQRLKELKIPLKINSCITPYNANELSAIVSYCRENDFPLQATTYSFPSVRGGNRPAVFTPEQSAELQIEYDKLRLTKSEFEKRVDVFKNREKISTIGADCSSHCRGGRSTAWIDWQGNMTYCGMVEQNENNVLKNGFVECWEKVNSFAEKIRLPKKCAGCEYRFCCNICAAKAYCETGSTDIVPEYLCQTAKCLAEKMDKYTDNI